MYDITLVGGAPASLPTIREKRASISRRYMVMLSSGCRKAVFLLASFDSSTRSALYRFSHIEDSRGERT